MEYLRILLIIFGVEDFQRVVLNLLRSNSLQIGYYFTNTVGGRNHLKLNPGTQLTCTTYGFNIILILEGIWF